MRNSENRLVEIGNDYAFDEILELFKDIIYDPSKENEKLFWRTMKTTTRKHCWAIC